LGQGEWVRRPPSPRPTRLTTTPPRHQVAVQDEPDLSCEQVTIPTSSEPRPSSPAVPLTCPKQRSATVAHGQQRSLTEVPDLRHRRKVGSPTLLPKLAVSTRLGRAGAATVGATRSVTDNSGMPTPRSEHVPVDRRVAFQLP